MDPRIRRHAVARKVSTLAAGVALAGLAAAYLFLRYALSSPWALQLAQLVYLTPALLAAVSCASAAVAGPPGSRERLAWALMAFTAGFAALGEAAYSLSLLQQALPDALVWVDVFNAASLIAFVGFIGVSIAVDRLGWWRGARAILDAVAILAVSLAVISLMWFERGVGPEVVDDLAGAIRLSAYALMGVVVLAATAALKGSYRRAGAGGWSRTLVAGLAVFGLGLLLWPVWSISTRGVEWAGAYGIVADVAFLIGYGLVFVAGLQRVLAPGGRWIHTAVSVDVGEAPWPGLVVSGLVCVSALVLGYRAYLAPPGSVEEGLLLVTGAVAVSCLVLRTTLASVEGALLERRVIEDAESGALSMREFDSTAHMLLEAATRFSTKLSLYSVDLGHASVDRERDAEAVSVAVASKLSDVAPGLVFRRAGQEFLVLAEVSDVPRAERVADRLFTSISAMNLESVIPRVGWAAYPEDADSVETLLDRAESTRVWLEHRGLSRCMRYDPRVVRTAVIEDRERAADERARRDMAQALAAAADARDPANFRHSRNVASLAVLFAESLGIEERNVRNLEIAAVLHDVGKIALPDVMLGGHPLSARHQRQAREHVTLGERLISSLGIEGVPQWVRSHHERWDGQGYPDGLSAEAIPVESRIIALADAYDGMTTGKRYGAPMSKAAALQEIDLGLGARFDPALGERFIMLVGETDALGWSDEWPAA